jgi:hypothetical protein
MKNAPTRKRYAHADFPPDIRAAIDATRDRLTITHDADQKTLRIDGLSYGAWLVFSYHDDLTVDVVDAAANIRYDPLITGMKLPPWWETNAAWESARAATSRLLELPPAVHTLRMSRVTVKVASYLAMRDRVQQWGGFTGERERLPFLLKGLSDAERRAVDDRLAGRVLR